MYVLHSSSIAFAQIALDDWQYYAGNLSFEELPSSKQLASLDWEQTDSMRPPGCQGRSTCLMRVRIPSSNQLDPVFFSKGADLNLQAYIDDSLIFTTSEAFDKFRGYQFILFPISRESHGKFLYLRFYSNHVNIGIFLTGAHIYPRSLLYREIFFDNISFLIAIIAILTIALFFLVLGLSLKNAYGSLYLSGFAISFSLVISGVPVTTIMQMIIDSPLFLTVSYFTCQPLIPAFFSLFIASVKRNNEGRFYYYSGITVLAMALLFPLYSFLFLDHIAKAILPSQALTGIAMIALLARMVLDFFHSDLEFRSIVVATAITIAIGFYDLLASLEIFPWTGLKIQWGFLFLILSFLYVVYRRYHLDQEKLSDKKKLDLELEITHSIQHNILATNEKIPGLEISHLYLPADITSGDWFGHYYIKHSHTAYFFCGDVTGHGITAALVSSLVAGVIEGAIFHQMETESGREKEDVLRNIFTSANYIIAKTSAKNDKGMTLLGGALDLKTGHLSFISAGHHPPLLVSKSSQFLPCSGIPLGLHNSFSHWKVRNYTLQTNDIVLLYTDGLIENEGQQGTTFKLDRFSKNLTASNLSSADLINSIADECNTTWQALRQDDCSLLALQFKTTVMPTSQTG